MAWGRMDDKFHRNPKVRSLRQQKGGRDALGVWTYWWSWCLDGPELNGFVPRSELSSADLKAANLLVLAGLWDLAEGGFTIHDFHIYNPSRADLEHKRVADRERVAAKRAASRENVASDSPATNPRVAPHARDPIPIPREREKISDPAPSRSVTLSARAPANGNGVGQEGIEPDTADPDPAWTQERMGRLFQREWQLQRNVAPTLHCGRNPLAARELFESSVETAEGRGVHPEALFLQTLRAWIPTVGKTHSPFAFFAASWTGLLSTDPQAEQRELEKKLRDDVENQLRAIRAGAHNASR
jgi:hypothetical protein